MENLNLNEVFAMLRAERYLGCLECKESHTYTSFCIKCGKCFVNAPKIEDSDCGMFFTCSCGEVNFWD